jgi:galactonate dehydratase
MVPVQLEWEDGYRVPLAGPGLGIEFDREAAKEHPFHMMELPHLHRRDGSFTNW